MVFDSYEVFKDVKAEQFNQATSATNNIDYILNNLKSPSMSTALSKNIQDAHS